MAWIEVHQALRGHKKTLSVRRELRLETEAQVIGHMVCLWMWALDNEPGGDLSGLDDETIAYAANFPEERAAEFVRALEKAGFLDERRIHNWDDYAGRLISRRESNRDRQRRARERERDERVTSQPHNIATVPNTTVPNRTEPDTTQQNPTQPDPTASNPAAADPAPAEGQPARRETGTGEAAFARFWGIYPKKNGLDGAKRAFFALKPDEGLLKAILDAVEKWRHSDQWRTENGRFVPSAERWLTRRGWEEIPPPPRQDFVQRGMGAYGEMEGFNFVREMLRREGVA